MAKRERVDRGLYRVENKDGSVSWMIDYLNPDKKRIRKTFSTKKQAVAERAARIHMMAKGEYSEFVEKKERRTSTLGDLIKLYHENYQDQTTYIKNKQAYIESFKKHFGSPTLLTSIEYGDLKTYRNTLKKTLSKHGLPLTASTINSYMSCLRHMFKEAIEYKMVQRSPFNDGKSLMLKLDNTRERYLTPEEIRRFVKACPTHLKQIVKCALFTGLRVSDVLKLKWSDISDGQIYVRNTKGKNYIVPVSEPLAELFDQIREGRKTVGGNVVDLKGKPVERPGIESEHVFTYMGKPITGVRTAFRSACKKANLTYGRDKPDGVTFHTLRHTYGTHLAIHGTHARTIQELLGHKSLKMTERYIKVADESKKQAVNGLNYGL
jgi:integrase